jgi:hypothetical protein
MRTARAAFDGAPRHDPENPGLVRMRLRMRGDLYRIALDVRTQTLGVTPRTEGRLAMKERELRAKERRLKRRYFSIGVFVTGVVLLGASIAGTALVATDADPRPFAAALPLLYAPILLGGVGWLAWTAAAPARGKG